MALFPILYFSYRFATKGKVVPVAELDFYSGSRDIEEEEELPPKNFVEKAWRAVRLFSSLSRFVSLTITTDYVKLFPSIFLSFSFSLNSGSLAGLHYMVCRNKFCYPIQLLVANRRATWRELFQRRRQPYSLSSLYSV